MTQQSELHEWRLLQARCKQLFVLDDGLVNALIMEDAQATLAGLVEMNLAKPPYQCLCIDMNLRTFMSRSDGLGKNEEAKLFVNGLSNGYDIAGGMFVRGYFDIDTRRDPKNIMCLAALTPDGIFPVVEEGVDPTSSTLYWMMSTLIVSLATRNVVKRITQTGGHVSRKHPRRAFAEYTTLILPSTTERELDPDHPPTGATVMAHWRRGYIRRRQHYGKGNALIKEVWIAPVYVNADPDYVQLRRNYRVKSPAMEPVA